MYKKRLTPSSYGRGKFQNNKKPFRSGKNRRTENIDTSRFINKVSNEKNIEIFSPKHKFVDFKIEEVLKKNISNRNYQIPTPIQDESIPQILEGKDLVGIANTGTGKTGAFLIPLINAVILNKKEKALIVVPTRELAIQIEEELKLFTKGLGINSVTCVGGMNIGPQINRLKSEYNFIVGTPGRLKDLIARKRIDLNSFHKIVLDEADRMLDMGFIADMRYIMSLTPKNRQTLFFSATMSDDVKKIIGEFLKDPVFVSVKYRDTSKNVDQDVVHVDHGQDKVEVLHDLLIKEGFTKVLVFGRTKRGVEKLSRDLIKKGFRADSIHGDKSHYHRQRALKSFKEDSIVILVATDVAARGLDIPNVSHVINFDTPENHDDYAHRIGRTGRGDKSGKALTFVEKSNKSFKKSFKGPTRRPFRRPNFS